MTNRMNHEITHVMCSFCKEAIPKPEIFASGISNATICNNCVKYVRIEMGLEKDPLQEIIKSV